MNRAHAVICSSRWWARTVERELLPWGLARVELGEQVLEIGPGFGATTRVLAGQVPALSVLELEPRYCDRGDLALSRRLAPRQPARAR